ncbi:arylsulfotransferase (ASST) [Mycoplasma sp. CAG:956]|nr:arylsulfotransferase (ASST) [Mycoplasma sp. CAG:956]
MQRKKRNKKIITIIISIIVLIILGSIFYSYNNLKGKNGIDLTASLVTKQNEIENTIKTNGYTIDNPKVLLDPYDASPLTALILFETEEEVSPKITIEGKDKLTTIETEFAKNTKHYLPIYGLYADYNNKVDISYTLSDGKKITKQVEIQTDKLPDDFVLPTSVKKDSSKLTNDLYFFTPSSKGYTCAYDVNGDVRWYLSNNAVWDNTRLKNGHMMVSTERLVNSPYYMTGLYEIDLLGHIYNEYSLKGGYHHDYFELPNGNLLVASDDFNNESGTVEDYIVELDRTTGNIIKTWDLKDILNMEDGKSENWSSYDWFHNNSVWYDEASNSITLSGRHQDAVINIDYTSGKLNWIIGDPTNWSSEYQKYFFTPVGEDFEWQWSQHAAMITPEGYVFIFDNGNNKSKDSSKYVDATNSYSRGVMYKIDTDKMTIEQVYEYGKERGSSFYSPYISDVDYLSKNHYLIHSGGIVYVDGKNSNQPAGFSSNTTLKSDTVEVLNNKVIFEIVLPTNNYRVEKLSLYTENDYKNTLGKRLGSLGETKVSKKDNKFIKTVEIDDDYNKRNITITNEEDRLVISGRFKKGENVSFILRKGFTNNYYDQIISKKPYTALCVDIFTEEETNEGINITRYINKETLNGKYSIYIKINDKIYKTNNYIEI